MIIVGIYIQFQDWVGNSTVSGHDDEIFPLNTENTVHLKKRIFLINILACVCELYSIIFFHDFTYLYWASYHFKICILQFVQIIVKKLC